MMIVSIGLSIFLRNVFQFFSGAQSRNYSQYAAVRPWEIGPILITPRDVAVIVVGILVLVATTSLLQFTRLGKATRAVADNPALSASTGINVERVISLVWIGGAALAGFAGALLVAWLVPPSAYGRCYLGGIALYSSVFFTPPEAGWFSYVPLAGPATIRWNTDKRYLLDLERDGAPYLDYTNALYARA